MTASSAGFDGSSSALAGGVQTGSDYRKTMRVLGWPVTSARHLVKASACPPSEPSRAERKLSSFA